MISQRGKCQIGPKSKRGTVSYLIVTWGSAPDLGLIPNFLLFEGPLLSDSLIAVLSLLPLTC